MCVCVYDMKHIVQNRLSLKCTTYFKTMYRIFKFSEKNLIFAMVNTKYELKYMVQHKFQNDDINNQIFCSSRKNFIYIWISNLYTTLMI